MSNELLDSLVKLKSLACSKQYKAACSQLLIACTATTRGKAQQHIREAVPHLRLLPQPIRRLAWIATFGALDGRRVRAMASINELWDRGISRSLDALVMPSGAMLLAAACSEVVRAESVQLLRDVGDMDGFATLLRSAEAQVLAIEAIDLWLLIPASGCEILADAADKSSLNEIAKIASLAHWLHALGSPSIAQVPPPEGHETQALLTMPCMRGMRRRSARVQGRHIGAHTASALRPLTQGAKKIMNLGLPVSMKGGASIRPLLAPLITDLLSCAVATLAPHGELREGAHALSQNCPRLIDEAMAELQVPLSAGSRVAWLKSLLGISVFKVPSTQETELLATDELENLQ